MILSANFAKIGISLNLVFNLLIKFAVLRKYLMNMYHNFEKYLNIA